MIPGSVVCVCVLLCYNFCGCGLCGVEMFVMENPYEGVPKLVEFAIAVDDERGQSLLNPKPYIQKPIQHLHTSHVYT